MYRLLLALAAGEGRFCIDATTNAGGDPPAPDSSGGGGGGTVAVPPTPADPASGSGASGEPAKEPAAKVEPTPEEAEWNGELESIQKEPWWADVPEANRARVTAGLKTKHGNWQNGYQKKFGEFSTKEKAIQAELDRLKGEVAKASERRDYFSELLGEDDKVGPLTTKLTGLEKSLGEKESAITERDTKIAAYEARLADVELERQLSRHEKEFPDIYADFEEDAEFAAGKKDKAEPKGAYTDFCRLTRAGIPEADAARMIRADMKERGMKPRVVEEPPASVRNTSVGGPVPSKATREPNESYDATMARLRRDAEDAKERGE